MLSFVDYYFNHKLHENKGEWLLLEFKNEPLVTLMRPYFLSSVIITNNQ